MADLEITYESADGYVAHQGHSVSYTDAYIKVRRSFLNEALRTLKGAPLSVFFAVSLSQDPPDVDTICSLTGYHTASACRALDYLVSHHFLEEMGRNGSRGVKVYRPLRYAWSGSDKQSPPKSRISPSEIRRESFARHDDDDFNHKHSHSEESFMNARKTFADCGIEGKNLDLLARAVAPEIAREWADWLHAVDRKRWTRPEGYLVKKLLGDKQTAGDPKAKPPFVKTESAEGQRPIIGRISGHLAEKARALQRERAQEEGEE